MPTRNLPVVGEGFSQQASLLVSVLIRYPELVSARFGPVDGNFVFSVMLSGACADSEIDEFRQIVNDHLAAFMQLAGEQEYTCELVGVRYGEHTLLEFTSDVASLSQQEISLIMSLVRAHFSTKLLYEASELLREEDNLLQEEIIDEILEDVRVMDSCRELVGYREAGRVLVFNRKPAETSK